MGALISDDGFHLLYNDLHEAVDALTVQELPISRYKAFVTPQLSERAGADACL